MVIEPRFYGRNEVRKKMVALVQYFPLDNRIGYAVNVQEYDSKTTHEFYEHVNASDLDHNSIVLRFKDEDWRTINVKEEFRKIIMR